MEVTWKAIELPGGLFEGPERPLKILEDPVRLFLTKALEGP